MDQSNSVGTLAGPGGTEKRDRPALAIAICTADRPDMLRRCLNSVVSAEALPDEIIVSDDSEKGDEAAAVCAEFPGVLYVRGPRTGLCANRNALARRSTADFISFLDDDAMVSSDFVRRAMCAITDLPPKTILTGTVIETGKPVMALNRSFLGFFGKPPRNGYHNNINLNCNIIPRSAFTKLEFDETIIYGYEDMDFCAGLISIGYKILFDQNLVNMHLPPSQSAKKTQYILTMSERARFYTSIKNYYIWEKNYFKLMLFIILAPIHRFLHAIKAQKWFDLKNSTADIFLAIRAVRRVARARKL